MNEYYFLYKDSLGKWDNTTNPMFIAEHKYCRAIPKYVVHELGYDHIKDFIYDLNNETYPEVSNIGLKINEFNLN